MRREVALYYVALLGSVTGGVALGKSIAHPGDPPHVFTYLVLPPLFLLVAATTIVALGPESRDRARRLVGLAGLTCYAAWLVTCEPFDLFARGHLTGLLALLAELAVLAGAGRWLAGRGLWPLAAACVLLVGASVSLLTFNLHWSDPVSFLGRVRT